MLSHPQGHYAVSPQGHYAAPTNLRHHTVPTRAVPKSGRSEPPPSQNAVVLVMRPLVMQKQTRDVLSSPLVDLFSK